MVKVLLLLSLFIGYISFVATYGPQQNLLFSSERNCLLWCKHFNQSTPMSAEESLFDVTLVIILGGENFLFTLTAARKIEFF